MSFPPLHSVLGRDTTPAEVQERLDAMRAQRAFLILRDGERRQRIVALAGDRFVLGRAPGTDLCLDWDPTVSAVHVNLERGGQRWAVDDDGLSRNGTFVNGTRVRGRRLLAGGDVIRVGATLIGFVDPRPHAVAATLPVDGLQHQPVSDAQRRVLVALCRPLKGQQRYARPASNEEIAAELVVSVETVKSHLGKLYAQFGLGSLAPNEKRARLAWIALEAALVEDAEL